MSLTIITDKNQLNTSNLKFVDYNDIYFNSVQLQNNETTEKILQHIDKAHYLSENTFLGRDKELGALNKTLLSTGCKTLLNILYNPDTCFSVAECGPNALESLSYINNGIAYWDKPVLFLIQDMECDIIHNNKHYSKFMDFLDSVIN